MKTDYSRRYVSSRLAELHEAGLIERVDDGVYRITEAGGAYLAGELDGEELEREE